MILGITPELLAFGLLLVALAIAFAALVRGYRREPAMVAVLLAALAVAILLWRAVLR